MIKPGIFYNGIDGYSIRIGKKEDDDQTLTDVLIYDHTENRGNTKMIIAEHGKMAMSEDERFLLLSLFKGASYEEQENRPGHMSRPLLRTEFEEELINRLIWSLSNLYYASETKDTTAITEDTKELFSIFLPPKLKEYATFKKGNI